MKFSIVFFFIMVIISILQTCEGIYNNELAMRMKNKIFHMQREVLIDAIVKRATINHLKDFYDWRASFQVSEYVHQIRLKYTRLTYVYLRCNEFYASFTFETLLQFLTEAHHLASYIDNLVNMLEEWEDKSSRKKRITRSGGNPIKKSSNQKDARKVMKVMVVHTQKDEKRNDSIITLRQKQKDYMERKKILWSLAHGNSRANLKRDGFKQRNRVEEGFQSDMDVH